MNDKLRQGVNEHLQEFQLDQSQLDKLMAMQAAADQQQRQPGKEKVLSRHERPHYLMLATAASVLLALIVVWQSSFFASSNVNMPKAIAMEVAKNHIKLKPLEVSSARFSPVRQYFTELDFAPLKSSLYQLRGNALLGARYCSIAGISAAQIRYKDEKEQLQTLYQVGYAADVYGPIPDINKGEKPLEVIALGLKTTQWVEQGLLMVAVENIDMTSDD